jgi:hypothetical protein
MSFLKKLAQARAELDTRHEDPWRKTVEAAVRGMDIISTAALLDAVRVPATTGTARRLAAIMRDLHFIPIKSRRLMPGGRAGNTVTRGWARPIRTMKSSLTTSNTGSAGSQPRENDPMNYVILKNYDHYAIVNDDADFIVGRVYPLDGQGFQVSADMPPDWGNGDVAVVESLDDAIPALAAYYENHPPKWESETATRYEKQTQLAVLRVEQGCRGNWLAYRDDHPMLRDGMLAYFTTCEEAQQSADAHLLDLYPNAKPIYDGLSWLPDPEIDWRSCPHRVEARAQGQRMASRWLP